MQLNKLQTLAEMDKRARDLDEMRRLFDNMEGSIMSVQKWAEGQLLANAIKKHGHPATESKAFREAVKKMYSEFEDLKMAMIMPLEMTDDDK